MEFHAGMPSCAQGSCFYGCAFGLGQDSNLLSASASGWRYTLLSCALSRTVTTIHHGADLSWRGEGKLTGTAHGCELRLRPLPIGKMPTGHLRQGRYLQILQNSSSPRGSVSEFIHPIEEAFGAPQGVPNLFHFSMQPKVVRMPQESCIQIE